MVYVMTENDSSQGAGIYTRTPQSDSGLVHDTDLDQFCIYCQVEYETPDSLKRHIHRNHAGTYAAESHPLGEGES